MHSSVLSTRIIFLYISFHLHLSIRKTTTDCLWGVIWTLHFWNPFILKNLNLSNLKMYVADIQQAKFSLPSGSFYVYVGVTLYHKNQNGQRRVLPCQDCFSHYQWHRHPVSWGKPLLRQSSCLTLQLIALPSSAWNGDLFSAYSSSKYVDNISKIMISIIMS